MGLVAISPCFPPWRSLDATWRAMSGSWRSLASPVVLAASGLQAEQLGAVYAGMPDGPSGLELAAAGIEARSLLTLVAHSATCNVGCEPAAAVDGGVAAVAAAALDGSAFMLASRGLAADAACVASADAAAAIVRAVVVPAAKSWRGRLSWRS